MNGGWLEHYLALTEENEAPELFHLWAAVAVLGHAMGRRVYMNRYFYKLYPAQLMVCLVSRSAISRKTTAAEMAIKFLRYLPQERVNLFAEKLSPQSLYDAMERSDDEPCIGLIYAEELGSFLSKESYAEQLATNICALNNAKDYFKMQMRSHELYLHQPCVGMLACTTPTGLAEELPKAAQTAGFLGRLITVFQEGPKCANPLLEPPKGMKKLRRWLAADLARINQLSGPMTFTEDGKEWYRDWYHRVYVPKSVAEGTGFAGRVHDHLARVAMVFSASRSSVMTVNAAVLESAWAALDQVQALMPHAVAELDTSPLDREVQRFLQLLRARPGKWLEHKRVYKIMYRYVDPDKFKLVVRTAVDSGRVVLGKDDAGNAAYKLLVDPGEMLMGAPEAEEG